MNTVPQMVQVREASGIRPSVGRSHAIAFADNPHYPAAHHMKRHPENAPIVHYAPVARFLARCAIFSRERPLLLI